MGWGDLADAEGFGTMVKLDGVDADWNGLLLVNE